MLKTDGLRQGLTEYTNEMVDRFINAYLAANPKGIAPAVQGQSDRTRNVQGYCERKLTMMPLVWPFLGVPLYPCEESGLVLPL